MRYIWKRDQRPPNTQDEDPAQMGREPAKPTKTDILAIVIALFQLFLPLVVGLIIVGAIVALVLR